MNDHVIRYHFEFPSGEPQTVEVRLHPETLESRNPIPEQLPEWTRLEHEQCPNCPLPKTPDARCPAAVAVAGVVQRFATHWSIDEAEVRVELPERTIYKRTAVQHGLGSLLGVLLATSGCPVLAKLRPLTRYHLPFASESETIFRAVSMYLVAQFLRAEKGGAPDWTLDGLADLYREIGTVNRHFAARLREAKSRDANLNAVIILDAFAKSLPDVIETRLQELRNQFRVWE